MAASGQKGIPCAFVTTVQSGQTGGKVVYIGHPMAPEFETAVRLSLTGRYNPVLAKKAQPLIDAARRAIATKNYKDGYKRFDEVIALDPAIFAPIAIEKYGVMLNDEGNEAGAKAYAAELLKGLVTLGDAAALRDLAIELSSKPANKHYDFDLAMQAAEAMLKVAGKNDPAALATVAGVEYARGDFAKAVESQKKAYRIASPSRKAAFKATLDAYELALKKGVKVKVPETAQAPAGPVETVPAKP
jgi:tetratricopeptide (TPR) repeat protein